MSAGTAQPIADSQTATWDQDAMELRITYQVPVTSPLDGALTVMLAPGLPRPGWGYSHNGERNPLALLQSLVPTRVTGTRLLWHVAATWRTPSANDQKQGTDEQGKPTSDPLRWHPKIETSYARFNELLEQAELVEPAIPGRAPGSRGPVVTSAGVPFNPPPEVDRSHFIVRITSNLPTYSTSLERFVDTINRDTFSINRPRLGFSKTFQPRTAKWLSLNASLDFANDRYYWPHTVELEIDANTWDLELLDKGLLASVRAGDPDGHGGTISFSDYVNGKPPLRRLTDFEGVPLSDPVLLDGQGQPLAANAPPVYLKYRGYKLETYSPLPRELRL